MNLFACSAYQHSDLKDKFSNSSIKETLKKMSPSTQTLIDELESVVSENGVLEYQDLSTLIELLPLLVTPFPL